MGSYSMRHVWGARVSILFLSMRTAFFRYVLPYGQMSYWGATVIISLLSIVSNSLTVFIWRAFTVSEAFLP